MARTEDNVMTDVVMTPQIRCDNCGAVDNKIRADGSWVKPRTWGNLHVEGAKNTQAYGLKDRLAFVDLCPKCAGKAFEAASEAMKQAREEGDAHD